MSDSSGGSNLRNQGIWRGVDFSGLTVVLGAGTGQLIRLLDEQAKAADGQVIVLSFGRAPLQALAAPPSGSRLTRIQGRPRQVPVLAEVADLLVVSGVLREIPPAKLDTMTEELWRILVPGGQLRISDIVEPSEAPYNAAWSERNRIVRKLAASLEQPTALAVSLPLVAASVQRAGFENLAVSLLPGYALTDEWLENTVASVRTMASRLTDRSIRDEVLGSCLARLTAAYARGDQRAAERFVLRGSKPGDLALDMEASFVEKDLWTET